MPNPARIAASNDNRPRRAAVIHSFFCTCHECDDLRTPVAQATDLYWAAWAILAALTLITGLALHALAPAAFEAGRAFLQGFAS
jgi:hypothetical protein